MNEESKRLSDTELCSILQSSPPPAPEDELSIRERPTKLECPLCHAEGLVTPLVAEAYHTLVRGVRRKTESKAPDDLDSNPELDDPE